MALTGRAASRNEAWLAQGAHCPTSLGASTAEEVLGMPPLSPAAAGKETPHRLLAVWGLPAGLPGLLAPERGRHVRLAKARRAAPGCQGPSQTGRASRWPYQLHSAAPFRRSVSSLDTPPSS